MIIVMKRHVSEKAISSVVEYIRSCGLTEHLSVGLERTIIGAVGDERIFDADYIVSMPGVEKAVSILDDWQIISRESKTEDTVISVKGVQFGTDDTVIIEKRALGDDAALNALTSAVFLDPFVMPKRPYESADQINKQAILHALSDTVAIWHKQSRPVMVQIRDLSQLEDILNMDADILYLEGSDLENPFLLKELGHLNRPLVLCKAKHHSLDDWLRAVERVAIWGNHQLILGDQGTMSFEKRLLSRPDIESIAMAKQLTHLPILSHLLPQISSYLPLNVLMMLMKAVGTHALIVPSQPQF